MQVPGQPVEGEQVEGDGTAYNLLHVRTDDGQLHHQPQEDAGHLKGGGAARGTVMACKTHPHIKRK